jgi:hypothetical protein
MGPQTGCAGRFISISSRWNHRMTGLSLARAIAGRAAAEHGRGLIVGGWVRDRLLGPSVERLDIEVFGIDASRLRALLEGFGRFKPWARAFRSSSWKTSTCRFRAASRSPAAATKDFSSSATRRSRWKRRRDGAISRSTRSHGIR